MKIKFAYIAFATLFCVANQSYADSSSKYSGFECADELTQIIPLLGRGSNFPEFLFDDVNSELKRQNKKARLIKLTCNGEPKLQGKTNKQNVDGSEQTSLSSMTAIFPLTAIVKEPKKTVTLIINHIYKVENMNSPEPKKVTQTFQVIEQK